MQGAVTLYRRLYGSLVTEVSLLIEDTSLYSSF